MYTQLEHAGSLQSTGLSVVLTMCQPLSRAWCRPSMQSITRPSFTSMESAVSKKDVRTLTLSLSLTLTMMTCKRNEGTNAE